jgi:hypothetical protein
MARGRRLLRDCRAKLAGFPMPRPFSIEALCEQIARYRARRLYLHALPYTSVPELPCGVWIATPQADHVFHARGASFLHQRNIILHEMGHMLWDHSGGGQGDHAGTGLAALLTDLDPAVVGRILLRTRYSSRQEEEAEMVAALIMRRAGWAWAEPDPDGSLGQLADIFGLPRKF